MSYPLNAKEVLRLEGLRLVMILAIVQMCAILYLVAATDHLTEAQFSSIPQPAIIGAVLVLATSFVILITILTTSIKRTYAKYNEKAKFELMLRGLLEQVAASGSTPLDAKLAFANEYLDALTSDVAQAHLEHLPNRQGKQLLRDAVMEMQKQAGERLMQHVGNRGGRPVSEVVLNISVDIARLEILHSALNKE